MTLIKIIKLAREKYPHLPFIAMDANQMFYAYAEPPNRCVESSNRGFEWAYNNNND